MKKILIALLVLTGSALAQNKHSAVNPTLSLEPLDKNNCTYAVQIINHATKMIGLLESQTIEMIEANSAPAPVTFVGQIQDALDAPWPPKPPHLDTFVEQIGGDEKSAFITFGSSALGALYHKKDAPDMKSAKLRIAVEQMTFAYILELRGCRLAPGDVRLTK